MYLIKENKIKHLCIVLKNNPQTWKDTREPILFSICQFLGICILAFVRRRRHFVKSLKVKTYSLVYFKAIYKIRFEIKKGILTNCEFTLV